MADKSATKPATKPGKGEAAPKLSKADNAALDKIWDSLPKKA